MKWQARSKYTRRELRYRRRQIVWQWHSRFALTPKCIPETKHDSIVVPCHWVWLERYERRLQSEGEWEYRSYTGTPSFRQLVRE